MKRIVVSSETERITVKKVLRLMRNQAREESIRLICDDGGRIISRVQGGMVVESELLNHFLQFCAHKKILPISPFAPWSMDYIGSEAQNRNYEISVDEFRMFARPYGIEISRENSAHDTQKKEEEKQRKLTDTPSMCNAEPLSLLTEEKGKDVDLSRRDSLYQPNGTNPRVLWKIALTESWSEMCKTYGRCPTAAEAIRYLKNNDDTGVILKKGTATELWWKPQRGDAREVALKTVENAVSKLRTGGSASTLNPMSFHTTHLTS